MAIRRIPSLNWLRVFEAAARFESFARASTVLNMSPPAVSQQIRALEAHLGTALFDRSPRSVSLTRAGRDFLPVVQQSLRSVEATAAALFGNPAGMPLVVQANMLFACSWLAPRISDFRDAHPDIHLQLLSAHHSDEFLRWSADVQITFGSEPYGQDEGEHLFGERLYPVALPEIAAKIHTAADLLDHDLIEISTHRAGWLQVLESTTGIDLTHLKLVFADNTLLSLAMAASGFGISLARAPATDTLQRTYGLVRCLDGVEAEGAQSYRLVAAPDGQRTPAIDSFRIWLLQEAGAA